MHYEYDLFGWLAGTSETGTSRSTAVAPPHLDMPTTPGELRPNWTGWEWLDLPYAAPPPPPPPPGPPVPASVTRRQAKQALLQAGLLDSVQPAIDAIPDATQRGLAQIEWDDSQEFERHRPMLIGLATAIGLTSEQIDELFIAAAGL